MGSRSWFHITSSIFAVWRAPVPLLPEMGQLADRISDSIILMIRPQASHRSPASTKDCEVTRLYTHTQSQQLGDAHCPLILYLVMWGDWQAGRGSALFQNYSVLSMDCLGIIPQVSPKYNLIKSPKYEAAWPRSLLKSMVNS